MNRPISRGNAASAGMNSPLIAALELRSAGHMQEALAVLARAATFSPDCYNLRGDLELELGLITEAAHSYSAVLAHDSTNQHALYQLATCFCALSQWADAVEVFRALLVHATHRDDVRLTLGACLMNLNRPEEALAVFEQCWSSSAKPHAAFGRAVALQLLRRFDEAEQAYEKTLGDEAVREEALNNLITMSMEVFDLERIERYSRHLLESNPAAQVALQGLTMVALERQDYTTAAHYFGRFLRSQGDSRANDYQSAGVEYHLTPDVVLRMKQVLGMAPTLAPTIHRGLNLKGRTPEQ